MTKEELEKEAEEEYCKGCKLRMEQCLWAWRKVNGLNEPNEKNCSCKEVPAFFAGREKRIEELEAQNKWLKCCESELAEHLGKANDRIAELEKENRDLRDNYDQFKAIAVPEKERLQKENEELKERLAILNLNANIAVRDFNDLLTKAKNIIKTLADDLSMYSGNYQKELLEAKQFIKENEK